MLATNMAAPDPEAVGRGADLGLPTLTEVLGARAGHDPPAPTPPVAAAGVIDESAVVDFVLEEVAPRIDAMFEARLREVMAPALAQAAEHVIEDARQALGLALRDLVDAAVARALARRDGG